MKSEKLEFRKLHVIRSTSAVGRSQELVVCPFCDAEIWTYTWSRCGSGKRCHCGAILGGASAHKAADAL